MLGDVIEFMMIFLGVVRALCSCRRIFQFLEHNELSDVIATVKMCCSDLLL